MASTIAAGTSAGTAIAFSGDTSGSLVLQTNGTTTAVTLDTSQNATFAGKVTSAGALTLASNGTTTAVTIDTSQNVGIGYTSPYGKLSINAGNYAPASSGNMANGFTVSNNTTGVAINIGTNDTGGYNFIQSAYVNSAGVAVPLALFTGATERMRIDSSGNLLVGVTADPSGSGNNGASFFKATNNYELHSRSGVNTISYVGIFYNGNGTVGSISTNGSATSYTTSSDYRLKENIAPMQNALNVVQQLKPVTYNWKTDGSDGQGFIAHELQAIVPDCVSGAKDAVDAEGNPQYQGIDTSFLVATLTAAIQEQQALIIQLQADVAALKGVKA